MQPRRFLTGLSSVPVFAVVTAVALGTGVSVAFFGAIGTGAASASVGTLSAPTGVAGTVAGTTVNVAWTAGSVPAGATLTGYVITRNNGTTTTPACGSSVASPRPPSPTSCADTSVPNGTYTYRVTAVLNSWTAVSAPSASVVVTAGDSTPPTVTLAATSATGGWIGLWAGTPRLYYKSNAPGSVRVAATVTDAQSGPKSAAFPDLATLGWTNTAETVTSGIGSPPTITYTSSPWSWTPGLLGTPTTKTIVASDVAGNTTNRTLTFSLDTAAPTGGALAVNGTTATGGPTGNTSNNTSGSFAIGTRTDYTETQAANRSGLASSVLTRAFAPLVANACGTFGAGVVIAGAPAQGPLPTGCYRYSLTGTDRVGNAASRVTTVRVDLTSPSGGALSANGTAATAAGSTSDNVTGSWTLTRAAFTDPESGATSVLRRFTAPVSGAGCAAFSGAGTVITGTPAQTGTVGTCYRYVLTGTNGVGGVSTLTTTVRRVSAPAVTNVQALNGAVGVAGRPDQSDTLSITFSQPINPSTICSCWGASGDQSLSTGLRVELNDGNPDRLTVGLASGGAFNFGTLSLGSNAYTSGFVQFGTGGPAPVGSSISWTESTRTLTVTLGLPTANANVVAASALTYTPGPGLLTTGGQPVVGSFTTGVGSQF